MQSQLYIPKPLEEMSLKEQKDAMKRRLERFINEAEFNVVSPANAFLVQTRKQRNAYCRKIYNNTASSNDFNYLYRNVNKEVVNEESNLKDIITLEMPARVRHIPLIRPKLRTLISKEKDRPKKLRVYGVDHESLNRKKKHHIEAILDKIDGKLIQKLQAINMLEMVVDQKKMIMEQYMEMPEAANLVKQLNFELQRLDELISRELNLTGDERSKVHNYYAYSYKDFMEELTEGALHDYIDRHRIHKLHNMGFEEKMITDEEVYFCDWTPGQKTPESRLVRPEYLYYQYNEACEYIAQLDWSVEFIPMSMGMVRSQWGKYLKKEDLDRIASEYPGYGNYQQSNLTAFPDGRAIGGLEYGAASSYYSEGIDVYRCFWKEQVAVPALIRKNKKPAKFTKYTPSKPDFIRWLTKKEAEKMTSTDKKRKRMDKRNERIEVRYRTDLWEGIRIGRTTYILMGKREMQLRNDDHKSDIDLPYIGKAVNRFRQPNSLIWETRDIQELYNILHYQEELLVALSGVRGIVYDLAQKPEGMSPEEVIYYMRNGILPIKTVDDNGKPIRSSFNQFPQYDQTLAPAVGVITNIKHSLEELAGYITGISRQQQGQVQSKDLVGTTQMAIDQSDLATEQYHQEHDELREMHFTRLSNIFPFAYKDGKQGAYHIGKMRQEILNIPKGKLDGGYFRTRVGSGLKEQQAFNRTKQMAEGGYSKGQLSATELLTLLDMDSIHDMRVALKEFEDKAISMAQQSRQQDQDSQMQLQQQMIQMQAQMDQQLATIKHQQEMQLHSVKARVEEMKVQAQTANEQMKLQSDQMKVRVGSDDSRYKVDTEAAVEMAYLELEKQHLAIDTQLKSTELLMGDIKNRMELHKMRSKERVKD